MSHSNSEALTVEEFSKTRSATHFFWLPPVCPWHVFLPAEAAGFPETGWSCWLLRPVHFCGDWGLEGVLYSHSVLPCAYCAVCYYNSLPDCAEPAGSAWIAAGQKGLLVKSEKHSSEVERNILPSSGSPTSWSVRLTRWEKKRRALQVACSLMGIFFF